MFDLTKGRGYHWIYVFSVLSWEGFDPYLPDAKFPLLSDLSAIRPIVKDMLKVYFPTDQMIEEGSQIATDMQTLFDSTYQRLVVALGENKMQQFVRWGTQHDHMDKSGHQLSFVIYELRRTVNRDKPEWLSESTLTFLQSVTEAHRQESNRFHEKMDTTNQRILRDEWASTILHEYMKYYHKEGYDRDITSTLWSWVHSFQEIALLQIIADTLNHDELNIVNQCIRSQPSWIKSYEKSKSAGYGQPLDLLEAIAQSQSYLAGFED